jgi:hypothetical protein
MSRGDDEADPRLVSALAIVGSAVVLIVVCFLAGWCER